MNPLIHSLKEGGLYKLKVFCRPNIIITLKDLYFNVYS